MLTRKTSVAVLAGLVAGGLAAAAAAQAVVGGSAAPSGSYPFVARVDAGGRGCSGVLVHADIVLTAKNCFAEPPPAVGAPPATTTVSIGGAERLPVTEVAAHPDLNALLLRLATPVTGTTPVEIGGAPVAGETLRLAGFGRTATDWVPGRPHSAQVTVGQVTATGFDATATDGGVTTCQGDAGGPALRETDGRVVVAGLHDRSRQGGCLGAPDGPREAFETRADVLAGWLRQFTTVTGSDPVAEISRNLAADASFTASSSAPESWGWSLRTINDGVRDKNGWSSWSQTEVDHSEWVEFAFPAARAVNRVDLYPRVDVPGGSFPANFTISAWTGTAWETVLTRQNFANPGATPVRLSFPVRTTGKIRVQGTSLRLMQFSEIEAYESTNLAADATFTASSSAPESWGWSLRTINDGFRERNGWSSWSQTDVDHTEWVEFAFPAARQVSRVDLYPRVDVAGGSFPANFTISTWNGATWETVVTKQNFPNPGANAVRLPFAAKTTSKVRIQATGVKLVQLSEVEAYHSGNLAADATFTASSVAPADWGWAVRNLNDGFRDKNGWSSWSQTDVDHTEWVEFAFPAARQVTRVDLHPRVEVPGGSFPVNFTLSAWNGSAWQPILVRRNVANPGTATVRLHFWPRTTTKLRLEVTDTKLVQFNEISAY